MAIDDCHAQGMHRPPVLKQKLAPVSPGVSLANRPPPGVELRLGESLLLAELAYRLPAGRLPNQHAPPIRLLRRVADASPSLGSWVGESQQLDPSAAQQEDGVGGTAPSIPRGMTRGVLAACGPGDNNTDPQETCLARAPCEVDRGGGANEPAANRPFRQMQGTNPSSRPTGRASTRPTAGRRCVWPSLPSVPRGDPATPDQWASRELPRPTARHAVVRIESADNFATRWPVIASRLGIDSRAAFDVTADGARWIWDRVDTYWPHAQGTLDIYHALEHVADAAKGLYGEGTQAAQCWNDATRDALLAEGHAGASGAIRAARPNAVRASSGGLWTAWKPTSTIIATTSTTPRAGRGPTHRQRPDRGRLQKLRRTPPQADLRPLAPR